MTRVIKGIEKSPDVSLIDVNYDEIITALGENFCRNLVKEEQGNW